MTLRDKTNKIKKNFDFNRVGKIKFRYKGELIDTPFDNLTSLSMWKLFEEWKESKGIPLSVL